MTRSVLVREAETTIGRGALGHTVHRWEVVVDGAVTLTTAGRHQRDWQRVEHHVRCAMDHRNGNDLLVETLQQLVEQGDVSVVGSPAALAYAALIEAGYE